MVRYTRLNFTRGGRGKLAQVIMETQQRTGATLGGSSNYRGAPGETRGKI